MTTIAVRVHLDAVSENSSGWGWWGESEAIPGFSVAAELLPELERRTREALSEIVGHDVDVQFEFAGDDEPQATGPVLERDLQEARNEAEVPVRRVLNRSLVPA